MVKRISLWFTVSAAALLACRTGQSASAPTQPPAPVGAAVGAPATSLPRSTTTDSNIQRSIAEGGPAPTGYALIGTVEKVMGDRLMIHSEVNGDAIVKVNDGTQVTIDGRQARLSDLEPGMPVRASFDAAWFADQVHAGSDARPGDYTGPADATPPAPSP